MRVSAVPTPHIFVRHQQAATWRQSSAHAVTAVPASTCMAPMHQQTVARTAEHSLCAVGRGGTAVRLLGTAWRKLRRLRKAVRAPPAGTWSRHQPLMPWPTLHLRQSSPSCCLDLTWRDVWAHMVRRLGAPMDCWLWWRGWTKSTISRLLCSKVSLRRRRRPLWRCPRHLRRHQLWYRMQRPPVREVQTGRSAPRGCPQAAWLKPLPRKPDAHTMRRRTATGMTLRLMCQPQL